ncbi:hypothetical protein OBO34_22165 [Clostridiales Family XIII bacterium ASD5510]|uniref:Scaffolding protein n=2 Tax=Bacteria TaxID=2 RepID=A0A9J6QZY2_9FIRM|nr:hypothetical protein [Hominibacterium faecale]MCU7381023.1 hypothetical protein [Hominibacterium faecale]
MKKDLRLNLRMFDGAAAGGAEGDGGDAGFASQDISGTEQAQTSSDNSQVAADKEEGQKDSKSEFEELIKGDYKDVFNERVQGIVERRLKNANRTIEGLQGFQDQATEVLGILSARYGVQPDDMQGLMNAINNDDAMFEAAAEKAGLTPEQYRYQLHLQQQAELAQKQAEEIQQQVFVREQLDRWEAEAQQLQQYFPDFDLESECENPEFLDLLRSGVGVKAAFNAVHFDDIVGGVIQQTAQSVKQSTADNIRNRQQRPDENGISSKAGVVTKTDPSKMTAKEREELARRAMYGEKITFK